MKFYKYLKEESIIDPRYFNLISDSPKFKSYNRMNIKKLIKELGRELWIQRGKKERIQDVEKEIARRKYSKLEMAYLLYDVSYGDGKIPD